MGEYNFLPMWYRNNMERKRKNKINICIVILTFLSAICVVRYFINNSYIKELNKSIEDNIYEKAEHKKKSELFDKEKHETIDTLNNFKDNILKNCSIEEVYISEKAVVLESDFSNTYTLTKFIKDLEENKEYKIKKLDLEDIEKNAVRLKVSLEVKKDDKGE
jgi:ABC-type lipoprotein release transport system permease subunit